MIFLIKFVTVWNVLCLLNVSQEVFGAKILAVFPVPSISHQVVFRPLTQELARRGHSVTVITPDPAFPNGRAPENLKEIDLHDISYKAWQNLYQKKHTVKTDIMTYTGVRNVVISLLHVFIAQIQTLEVQDLINNKNNKYDLILVESIMRPALIFSRIFKAPVILVSSFGAIFNNNNIIGAPTHPLLYPSVERKRIMDLSLTEKLYEVYTHYSMEYAYHLNEVDENKLLQDVFGNETTPLNELYENVDMLFINNHPIWAENRPVPPGVVYMGGIHQTPKKELPKDLKTYLDSSKRGVIYLSFGTNVLAEMIPQEKTEIFVKVLSQLPYDVLWKWDKDQLPGKGKNIRLSKWFPQSDLLHHPNIKLFITQAGLQSTDEAISAGVPLVAVPMIADQWFNAEKYVKHGIGKKLDIEAVTAKEFETAIKTVIEDASYRKNIIKLRNLFNDQPEPPLQRAVWWVEYVIRHGGAKHLRSPGANISYAQYLEIEVLSIVVLAILTLLVGSVLAIVLLLIYVKKVLTKKLKMKLN